MSRASAIVVQGILKLGPQMLPFADAATPELPLRASSAPLACFKSPSAWRPSS